MASWSILLVASTGLHAGFQLTVTTLAYPALTRVARPDFARAHADHARAIVPLVALVYGAVVVASAGAVLATPASLLAWSAALASAVALLTTALRAAPLHGRLGRSGPEPDLLRALLRADRVRTLFALLAVAAAVVHALKL